MKDNTYNKNQFCHPTSGENELAETLKSELSTLGNMAKSFSPKPMRPIEIPEKKRLVSILAAPAFAFSLALLLVAFTYKIYTPVHSNQTINLDSVYHEIETDEFFMDEVDALVEDVAYSDFYPDAAIVESRYDFSDEFIEVIVPI